MTAFLPEPGARGPEPVGSGTIEVETRFGEGTTFIVWLPAAKETETRDELAAP